MITYVRGKLVQAAPGFAVIEANGLGYRIMIPANCYPRLPQTGVEMQLFTSFVIREASQSLYGFSSHEERDFFEEIMGVSGIGPKTALNLIGRLSLEEMLHAIESNDISVISKAPGIGKKTAQRLIIEMQGKIGAASKKGFSSAFSIPLENNPHQQKISDAVSALLHLGYNYEAAQKAVKKSLSALPESIDLSELIADALNNV